jgi:hypothetical protein
MLGRTDARVREYTFGLAQREQQLDQRKLQIALLAYRANVIPEWWTTIFTKEMAEASLEKLADYLIKNKGLELVTAVLPIVPAVLKTMREWHKQQHSFEEAVFIVKVLIAAREIIRAVEDGEVEKALLVESPDLQDSDPAYDRELDRVLDLHARWEDYRGELNRYFGLSHSS